MGSQQLLLIILGMVVIGIMVAIGITLFTNQAAATNRDAIANDLVHASSSAQAYWRKPQILSGGGKSFQGFNLQWVFRTLENDNGTYAITGAVTDSLIIMEGIGRNIGRDSTTPVKVAIRVYPSTIEVEEVN